MPTHEDTVTYRVLVELGRERARFEWERSDHRLTHCANAVDVVNASPAVSHLERTMLAFGYRDELHQLNARAELAAMR